MRGVIISLVFLVLLLGIFSISASAQAQGQNCAPTYGWDFCIENVNIQDAKVIGGEVVDVDTEVQNVGERPGTVVAILIIRNSQGELILPDSKKVRKIPINGTKGTTLIWNVPKNANNGEYDVSVIIMDPSSTHLFDSAGYTHSIIIEKPTLIEMIKMNVVIISAVITILSALFAFIRWWIRNQRTPSIIEGNIG